MTYVIDIMKSLFFILVLLPLFGAVGGTIKGVLHFSAETTQTPVVSRYGHGTMPSATPSTNAAPDVRAVVYVADAFPDSQFVPPKEHPVMDQRNESFQPYLLPVLRGTSVDFPNNDNVYHNVFSFSKTKTFDLGKYPTKTSKEVTFDKLGVVSIYCEIHSHMNAFILVLPNPYFDSVLENGEFEIHNVPPGPRTLKAFLGRGNEIEKTINVPKDGTVTVELFQ